MKFPMSECPLSFGLGCELLARANVQCQSWPKMAPQGGADPGLEALCWPDTLYFLWDTAPASTDLNFGGQICKDTYLVWCCPVFSKMLNLKTIQDVEFKDHSALKSRDCENSILLLGRGRSACLRNLPCGSTRPRSHTKTQACRLLQRDTGNINWKQIDKKFDQNSSRCFFSSRLVLFAEETLCRGTCTRCLH